MIVYPPKTSQALQYAVAWTLGLCAYGTMNIVARVAFHWPWQCFVVYATHMLSFQALTSPSPFADTIIIVTLVITLAFFAVALWDTWYRTALGIYVLLNPFHGFDGHIGNQVVSVALMFSFLDPSLWDA